MGIPRAIKPEEFGYAAWYSQLPAPPKDWFNGNGQCQGAPEKDYPESAAKPSEGKRRAEAFIRQYCGPCVVRNECTAEMLRNPKPNGTVHGGMMPAEATAVWRAADIIRREDGDTAVAARALGLKDPGIQVPPQAIITPQIAEFAPLPPPVSPQ